MNKSDQEQVADERRVFSILIPTWNNLPYLKLCVESIRRHSALRHQIIIHVNDGSDGTLDWVRASGLDYTYTEHNVGVCMAMNMMRTKVDTDYILFLNDDMYVLPGWDSALYDEIKRIGTKMFFLSATTIQPRTASGPVVKSDFGDSPENFREQELLAQYQSLAPADWAGATLPPNVVHRDLWDLAGGYSVEYTPGMYSDPDFTAKLWMCGVRYMKGLGTSMVYHFETKSTGRVKRNNGRLQFLLKWGMTSATFRKYYTHKGEAWHPGIEAEVKVGAVRRNRLRARLKAIKDLLSAHIGPVAGFDTKEGRK